MPVSLNQILKEIRAGKCKTIYTSKTSLWWTHCKKDVLDATQKGREYQQAIARREGKAILQVVKHEHTDPIGGEVVRNTDPKLFIENSVKYKNLYGKHKLNALMKAHHQNTTNFFSNNWQAYNDRIDSERNN